MLILPRPVLVQLIKHAYRAHPIEACGLLVAEPSSDQVCRVLALIEIGNAARATDTYQFEPDQQLAAWGWMQSQGLIPAAVYHTHTAKSPRPSTSDIAMGDLLPQIRQLIVSTRDPDRWRLSAWWIRGNRALPEPVILSPDEPDPQLDYQLSGPGKKWSLVQPGTTPAQLAAADPGVPMAGSPPGGGRDRPRSGGIG